MKIKYIQLCIPVAAMMLCNSCKLEEVHAGYDCFSNTQGRYAQDEFTVPKTDTTLSEEIKKTGICPDLYPYCMETYCTQCRAGEVLVNRQEDDDVFECVPCTELSDCNTESCINGRKRCQGKDVKECIPGCFDDILTVCDGDQIIETRCSAGCNSNHTACMGLECGTGAVFKDEVCVCDTKNHWMDDGNSCVCDIENHWIRSGNQCVCNSNSHMVELNGTCVCDAANHWVADEESVCACDAEQHRVYKNGLCECDTDNHFYQVGDECVELPCDPVSEIQNEDNSCSCNGDAHWVDVDGTCECDIDNHYYQVGNECVQSQCDPVREKEDGEGCVCNSDGHWVIGDGKCVCDVENHYYQVGNQCVLKSCDEMMEEYGPDGDCVCRESEHWIGLPGYCKCDSDNNYYEVDNKCTLIECNENSEIFDGAKGCVCNKAAHWIGTAGSCVCDFNNNFFLQDDGTCGQISCSEREVMGADNQCVCNQAKHWVGNAGACECDEDNYFFNRNGECQKLNCDWNKEIVVNKACVCDSANHWVGDAGNCVCDESNGYQESGGICKPKKCNSEREVMVNNHCVCDTNNHWVGTSGNCSCDSASGYYESNGVCWKKSCDSSREILQGNQCICDTSKHWTGTAGSCTCMSGYVLTNGSCQVRPSCGEHQIYDQSLGTCVCDRSSGYESNGSTCQCTASGFYESVGQCLSSSGIRVGNSIFFGTYPQNGNGREPIEWMVMAKNGNEYYLLSRYALDAKPFNTTSTSVTWSTCSLRSWLNGNFYQNTFTSSEKSRILYKNISNEPNPETYVSSGPGTTDYIFVPSYNELYSFYPVARLVKDQQRRAPVTAYALSQGAYAMDTSGISHTNGYCSGTCYAWYWLRNSGGDNYHAMHVSQEGYVYLGTEENGWVHHSSAGVRPAMWVRF